MGNSESETLDSLFNLLPVDGRRCSTEVIYKIINIGYEVKIRLRMSVISYPLDKYFFHSARIQFWWRNLPTLRTFAILTTNSSNDPDRKNAVADTSMLIIIFPIDSHVAKVWSVSNEG